MLKKAESDRKSKSVTGRKSHQHYGSLVVLLLEQAGLGLVLVVPGLITLGHVIRRRDSTWRAAQRLDSLPERRVPPLLPLVLGVLSLATLLVLRLSAPAVLDRLLAQQQGLSTAGVVVSSADHHTAEAVFDQTVSLSHFEVYLTTQVKPLTTAIQLLAVGSMTIAYQDVILSEKTINGDRHHRRLLFLRTD
jgi:hypothetical protein